MATTRAGSRLIKVIHIDDDEDQLVFAKLFLEQADPGLRITSTDDPQRVLSLVEGDEYECLVSDYCMPQMDGITLANKARQRSDLHIIVYTGQGSEEVAEAAFASGVDDYLRKEVDPSHYRVLAKRIRHSVEKRRTERLLRTRERELSWMVEHSSDAIFRIEFDKGVTRYNPAFATLYGTIDGDVIPMEDLVPSRIPHEEYKRFQQVTAETLARNQTQFKLLHKWVDSDGVELWLETQILAIIRDGEMKGFEATSRDVTDMKRVEAELLQSKDSLLNFVNSATDLVVLLDHDLGITEVNPAGLELWHKTRDEVVGRNIQEFEPFIGDPERLEMLYRALQTSEQNTLEDIVPHPGEPRRHIKLRIFKTYEGLGVVSSDVSETMMFQRELEESEKKLQILVDNIPDVFYIQGRIGMVFVSPNVTKMTGFTADEVTKPDPGFWGTLIYHEDAGRVREAKRRYIEENTPYDVEYRVQRKDGTWMWVRDRAAQKYDLEGESYFDGKLSDVTEQKLMERGLKGYVEHLEQMVKDLKTYSMKLEEMVKERNQLLVDAERNVAVGQVASMVGHDLRGPLQTINNAIYLLKNHPEKQGELVQTVQGAVRYAVKILDDLRTATRDSPLEVELVNLTALIVQALSEAPLPERINVNTQFAEGLEGVYLDLVKIRRVLDNLIRNACEAIEGEGTVTVRAYREGVDVVIEVADTGIGIPEDFLPNLFQTFKTTKRKGLGLGLAYTKKAVEAHGGRITVESNVGEGTAFRVYIPQPRVEPEADVGVMDIASPVESSIVPP